jgi:V/A-type H+/Na+-transporting ATPase subunit E
MTSKINELTEKIYKEGVDKAKAEAEEILAEARAEVDKLLKSAKDEKEKILGKAKKEADEMRVNLDSELKLSAKKFISEIKQQITRLITFKQVQKPVKEPLSDSAFIQGIIRDLLKNWNPQDPEQSKIHIALAESYKKDLEEFASKTIKEQLDGELDIVFDNSMKSGFKVKPGDGSYIISFTDESFENLFKLYLKETNKHLIFDKDD